MVIMTMMTNVIMIVRAVISSDADVDDNEGGSARLQAGGVLRRAKPNWPEPDLGQPAAAGPPPRAL